VAGQETAEERAGDEGSATPFGRYLLEERIARGGMGEVFRAVAVGAGGFEKPVVVKRILPSLDGVAQLSAMFIEEARLMSRLLHPNIVQVIDFGQGESDDYFLVMELVDGVDLRVLEKAYAARGEAMPVGVVAFILTQMLRGLAHAHTKAYGDGRTLVHRDISPGNVLLSRVGEVKVADFGVALVAQPGEGPSTVAGKPGYMAPEQVFGGTVDGRADVFSAGVVLHELLTAGPAFEGDDEVQQQASASLGHIRDVASLRPDAGADIAAVVMQALAPDPDHRFASARAMSTAIVAACRSEGIAIATADELAEIVERIAEERSQQGKRVVALADGEPVKRQLTRTGAFTMRVTDVTGVTDVTSYSTVLERSPVAQQPEARKSASMPDPVAETVPTSPPLRRGPQVGLAAAVLGLLAFGGGVAWWQLGRGTEPVPPASTSFSARERITEVAPSTSAPPEPATAPTSMDTGLASPAPTRSAPYPSPGPLPSRPVPSPPPVSSAPLPSSCEGKVLLASKGSWWVSGGPGGRVQSPGVYTWPCGSYGLTGTSRVDGKVLSRAVTVRQGQTASARFE
jgi:serine/threonine-protein kinase